MRRFGNLFKAQGAEGVVVFNQFHAGLKFEHLATSDLGDGLRGSENFPGDAAASGLRGDCHLADVHAGTANVRVGTPNKLTVLVCDEKLFPSRFGTEVVLRHLI
jgi:hypothetical protein